MIVKKNSLSISKWRKTVFFFAAFFCSVLIITGCKKQPGSLGLNGLSDDSLMESSGIDTFSIVSYTVLDDSVISMDPEFNLLGSYYDEVFGKMEASFYTQLTLSGFSPDFGDMNELEVDSVVMAFEYGGYYGKLSEQLFEVYEVTEEMTGDSVYLSSSVLETDNQNLVPTDNNQGQIKPDVVSKVIVGEDTLSAQLRIPLNLDFGEYLLEIAQNSTSDLDFIKEFKGLHFKVNNPSQMSNDGAILYLSSSKPRSKLTVYYSINDTVQESFDFLLSKNAINFNHVEHDYTGTRVEQVINDTISGNMQFYTQAYVSRAKIDFPTLKNLPKDIIIHNAYLELPYNYYTGDNFPPSELVTISSRLYAGDKNRYRVAEMQLDPARRAYRIDLRTYIQDVITGKVENTGVFISPKMFNTTAERIIFNGTNTTYKKKPKLNIVYTKL